MQTGFKIECHRAQSIKNILGFCDTCKVSFCKECIVDHIGHKTVKIMNYCEERKKSVLDQITTPELTVQLEEKRKEMTEKRNKLQKDFEDTRGVVKMKEKLMENKEENYRLEIGRMEATTRYLIGLEEEALTTTLKSACEEAMKLFNLEKKIREEFKTLDRSLANAKRKVEKMNKELNKLGKKIEALNYFRGDGRYEFDDDKWAAFLLLNERAPLFASPKYCINTTVENFRAFPLVEDVFDFEEVMKKELIDVGQGVRISKPIVPKNNLPWCNTFPSASLSHKGILAITYDGHGHHIEFTDLNTGEEVHTRETNNNFVGFYDDMILLLTRWKPLREATVENVFNGLFKFKKIEGTNNVAPWTDASLLQERRILYYPTMDDKMFAFNVDTRMNTEIDVGRKVITMASLTGVDCGVKAVFYSDDKCTYALNMDDTVTKIYERHDYGIKAVFPSSSNPKDFKSAVFEYDYHLMKGEKWINTSKLEIFRGTYSIVRVYSDIFLAYDDYNHYWYFICIAVP